MSKLNAFLALYVLLVAPVRAEDEPRIEITSVPSYGSLGYLEGKVTGVEDPNNYKNYVVATYIQPEGVGWWTKPYFNQRTVPVDPNGWFTANVTTGGALTSDPQTTLYSVNLLDANQTPELAKGLCHLPESLLFLDTDTYERYGETNEFFGRMWGIKESPRLVSPGPNLYSYDPNNVWVDPDGKLHLSIDYRDSNWYSTEVILTESLGYGRYLFQTSSRVDQLDSSAIFGAFLWDAFGEPNWPAGRCNREIDFEDGNWPSGPPGNTQFVVQGWNTPGNLHRFWLPDLSGDANLTRILTWEEGRLHFLLLQGHHGFDDYSSANVIEEWTYLHDPNVQHFIPDPERERFRFNLYLRDGNAPAGDGELEVVIDLFEYWFPLSGDMDRSGKVDADDINPFLLAMTDPNAYRDQYGLDPNLVGDCDGSGKLDADDITPFVEKIIGGAGAIPEPAGLTLLALGGFMAIGRRCKK